jgi:hypothetical protein
LAGIVRFSGMLEWGNNRHGLAVKVALLVEVRHPPLHPLPANWENFDRPQDTFLESLKEWGKGRDFRLDEGVIICRDPVHIALVSAFPSPWKTLRSRTECSLLYSTVRKVSFTIT